MTATELAPMLTRLRQAIQNSDRATRRRRRFRYTECLENGKFLGKPNKAVKVLVMAAMYGIFPDQEQA